MKLEIEVADLPAIPLRYYRGWTMEFNPKKETFQCPFLSLFGVPSVAELEKEMDKAIERRAQIVVDRKPLLARRWATGKTMDNP